MEQIELLASFRDHLAESGLLDAGQLAALERDPRVTEQTTDAGLASLLVSSGLLTRFQADRLLEGRSRGFFFDQYRILDVLGVGGMGCVYQAQDTTTGEPVALKVLAERLKHDRGMYARFQQEARVGLLLKHPHIIRTQYLGTAGGLPYMTMELIEGANLLELLQKHHCLPWGQACEFARQAALALEYLHRRGIVHRDVKPQNLLIDRRGHVRLLDFGLAMLREGEAGDEFSMAMIFGHESVGTEEFSAPEQSADSLTADPRSDVYSLGATLFLALTCRSHRARPKTPGGQPGPLRSVRDFVPTIPQEVAEIVARMLAPDPDDRFPSAVAAAEALSRWARPAPASFDFASILAQRKLDAQRRLASSRVSTTGLAGSTAVPALGSSVALGPAARRVTSFTTPQIGPDGERPASDGPPVLGTLIWRNRNQSIPLMARSVVIGRREDCDLTVAEAAVSSRHCELQFDGTFWWVRDLVSRNGTQVNGQPVTFRALRDGDELMIGNQQQFRISYQLPSSASAGDSRAFAAPPSPWPSLQPILISLLLLGGLLLAGWWFLLAGR